MNFNFSRCVILLLVLLSTAVAFSKNNNQAPVIKEYVSLQSENNLRQYRVSLENSYDDSKISSYEIDFGDGVIVYQKNTIHTYQQDGSYNLKLKVTDNKGLSSQKNIPLVVKSNLVFSESSVVFAAQELKKNKKYNFSRPTSASGLYKLVVSRNQQSFLPELLISLFNSLGLGNSFEYNILLNDIIVFSENEINLNTISSTKIVSLSALNVIESQYRSELLNIFDVQVVSLSTVEDALPPIIATDIQSNSFTNKNSIPVRISDLSGETTTYVWRVNLLAQLAPSSPDTNTTYQLILTTTDSNFSIPLNEGQNSFVLQSVDKFGQVSQYFYINGVVYDSTPPEIIQILPEYRAKMYVNELPKQIKFHDIIVSEPLSSWSVNGVVQPEYEIMQPITINSEGNFSVVFKAVDMAGNTTVVTRNYQVVKLNSLPEFDDLTFNESYCIDGPCTNRRNISFNYNIRNISEISEYVVRVWLNDGLWQTNSVASFNNTPATTVPIHIADQKYNTFHVALYPVNAIYNNHSSDSEERITLPIIETGHQITYDPNSPNIASYTPAAGTTYYVNSLPVTKKVKLIFDERISEIKVNNGVSSVFPPFGTDRLDLDLVYNSQGFQTSAIEIKDQVGNISNVNYSVNISFSSTVPNIKFDDSIIDLLTNQITVPISGTSDKVLSNIKLNGVPLTVSQDGLSFSGYFNAPANGRHRLELVGTDRWGNVGNAVTHIRVLQQLPNDLLNPPAPSLLPDPETGDYYPVFGDKFKEPSLPDACAALDQVFDSEIEFKEHLDVLEENLQDVPYQTVGFGAKSLKVPRKQDLENFYDNIQEKLDYLKAPYLMMCKGVNIFPENDCAENRRLFRIVMSEYPEPLMINALPIPDSVKRFAIPRTNICTGFDSSNLTCNDMAEFLPIIAEFVVPSLGQLLGSPVGQFVTETILCGELCDTPVAKTTPVCNQYEIPKIPEIAPLPAPISLPPRFGGPTPRSNWGGGNGGGGGSGGGWPDIGGDGSCGGWFEPSCPGGGDGSGEGPGDGKFICSAYPSLWFCGDSDGYDRDGIDIVPVDCAQLTDINSIINLANSTGVPLTEQFTAVVARCLPTSVPGYPNANRPVLTVITPVQNQAAEATVRITGYVNDLYAQVRINGQIVPTLFSVQGAYFDVTINTPADKKVLVEAANLFSLQANPVEINLMSEDLPQQGVTDVEVTRFTCAIKDGLAYCWGNNNWGETGRPRNVVDWTPNLIPVPGEYVKSISVASAHACAVNNRSEIYCWGSNTGSQLGTDAPIQFSTEPVRAVSNFGPATQVSASGANTCGLFAEGVVHCWGLNQVGQSNPSSLAGRKVVKLTGGGLLHCAVLENKDVHCWGRPNILGRDTQAGSDISISNVDSFESDMSMCGIVNGGVYCWGDLWATANGSDFTLNGSTPIPDLQLVPINVIPEGSGIKLISKGTLVGQRCAVNTDDQIICWGRPIVGDGSVYVASNQLRTLPWSNGSISKISTGQQRSCAIAQGNLYCWGTNHSSSGDDKRLIVFPQ